MLINCFLIDFNAMDGQLEVCLIYELFVLLFRTGYHNANNCFVGNGSDPRKVHSSETGSN